MIRLKSEMKQTENKMKRMCRQCNKRPAIFLQRHGIGNRLAVHSDNDHDLCMQCTRSLKSSMHTHALDAKLVENTKRI